MISRRLLRIKALAAFYAFNRRSDGNLPNAEKELMHSINKAYDLYHLILLLITEMTGIAAEKIDQALQKKIPSYEDLNPNRRFADNQTINIIRENPGFIKYVRDSGLSWVNYMHVPRQLLNDLKNWEFYNDYMSAVNLGFRDDKKFVIRLVSEFVPASDDLASCLEEQSIYWNDDLEYVIVMIDKTIKKIKSATPGGEIMLPLFKNSEDEDFVRLLFRKTILNSDNYKKLIDKNTTNWEIDRIALMDILVMQMAIAEITEFPEIPVKVTLNEYIEIAKYYCTSKSSTFVNGILDKVVREIRQEGMINKAGRGLIGEQN